MFGKYSLLAYKGYETRGKNSSLYRYLDSALERASGTNVMDAFTQSLPKKSRKYFYKTRTIFLPVSRIMKPFCKISVIFLEKRIQYPSLSGPANCHDVTVPDNLNYNSLLTTVLISFRSQDK